MGAVVLRLATLPYVVKRLPARNEVAQAGGLMRSREYMMSMTVSLMDVFGRIRLATKDRMALKLYMDKFMRPDQVFIADEMAFEFCFRIPSFDKNWSVKAVNKTSSS